MDIFLEFVKKHIALKKVHDVVNSCKDKHHLDGARRLINNYIKNLKIPREECDRIWKIWEFKGLQIRSKRN